MAMKSAIAIQKSQQLNKIKCYYSPESPQLKCVLQPMKSVKELASGEECPTPSPPVLLRQDYILSADSVKLESDESFGPPDLTLNITPARCGSGQSSPSSESPVLQEHSYCKPSPPRDLTEIKFELEDEAESSIGLKPAKTCKHSSRATKGNRQTGSKKRVTSKKLNPQSPAPRASQSRKMKSVQNNSKVTDFFPVRRSNRKTAKQLKNEQQSNLVEAILSHCEDGLQVVEIQGKGRGVVSTKLFKQGDFVVEYTGDLISLGAAKDREGTYSLSPETGCYMYYFKHNSKNYCVDATAESGKLGRLLNHSRFGNCCTKVVDIEGIPHLILVAGRDIDIGEELLYDYGDRSKESLEAHPWLAL